MLSDKFSLASAHQSLGAPYGVDSSYGGSFAQASGTNTPVPGASNTGTSTPVPQHAQAGQRANGSIRVLKVPEYFIEWKESSSAVMEEMTFLGGQILARVIFGDASARNFLSRADYCTLGPAGIFTV